MTLKSYRLDDETLNRIKTIKNAKGFKSEKEVLVKTIEYYILSEMIEDNSLEFQTYKKMTTIEGELKRLNNKINHVDLGVSINNLFLTSDFEINQHPKAIIDRDTFDSEYYKSAKKEITKLIREKDNSSRTKNTIEKEGIAKQEKTEKPKIENSKPSDDDDWLNV